MDVIFGGAHSTCLTVALLPCGDWVGDKQMQGVQEGEGGGLEEGGSSGDKEVGRATTH